VNALPLKAPVAMRHAKLIVNPDQVVRREILLRKGKYRIGRDPMNDIELDDSAVSFEHCELEISELGVTIRDLQSTNPLGGQALLDLRLDQRGVIQTEAFSAVLPGGRKWVSLRGRVPRAGGRKWVSLVEARSRTDARKGDRF